jgi:hypothetical protein
MSQKVPEVTLRHSDQSRNPGLAWLSGPRFSPGRRQKQPATMLFRHALRDRRDDGGFIFCVSVPHPGGVRSYFSEAKLLCLNRNAYSALAPPQGPLRSCAFKRQPVKTSPKYPPQGKLYAMGSRAKPKPSGEDRKKRGKALKSKGNWGHPQRHDLTAPNQPVGARGKGTSTEVATKDNSAHRGGHFLVKIIQKTRLARFLSNWSG